MSSPRPLPPPDPPDKPALSRDLVLFFVQFSVALNKSRAYPAGHPVLAAAMDVLIQHLNGMFNRRQLLTIGVSRIQLFVDGVGTEAEHPVLREMAERLHRHQLAAIQLRPGLVAEELADLLQALASETWRQGKPLGLEPLELLLGRWPHVALEPLPLEQLELGARGSSTAEQQAERVWQGLVHSALLTAQESATGRMKAPPGATKVVTGKEVVRAIKARRKDKAYNREVLDWVLQLGENSGDLQGLSTQQAVDELFAGLDTNALKNMLKAGTTPQERNDVIRRGARSLPVPTVLDLVKAATSLSKKSLSHSLLRLLGKLAGHGDKARGPIVVGAEEVLRDSVRQLVGEWDEEEDPAERAHRDLLALLMRPGSGEESGVSGKAEAGALRIVQMGLELKVDTPELTQALLDVRETMGLAGMVDLIERGTQAGFPVDGVWKPISDPEYLRPLLLDEAQEVGLLDRVLDHMGHDAISPLLEALESAESASRRRWLLRRIQEFGDVSGPQIVTRLPGKPWYVQRNLLSLLGTLRNLPSGFHPEAHTNHEDPRVRREAYKLLFINPEWRDGAIMRASGDPDMGIVRLALSAALEQCPEELPPRLLEHLTTGYRDQDIRVLAIRLMGKRPSIGGREWLLTRVASQRGWGPFRRFRLEPKSAEMLNALVVLHREFGEQSETAVVLRMAEASKDPDIRAASRGVMPSSYA